MRWPLRYQILFPFLTVQIVTIFAVAISAGWFAVRQVDTEVGERLRNVLRSLESTAYPLTSNILDQLRQLSGAHFVVSQPDGRITGSTLGEKLTLAVSVMKPNSLPVPSLDQTWIGSGSLFVLGGEEYFTGVVARKAEGGKVLVLYSKSELVTARWNAVLGPTFVGVVLLFLTPLTSLWISQRIARRIQIVQQHVARMAAGDLTPMPAMTTRDELRRLSESVNRMAVDLDQSMKHLRDTERAAMLTQLVGGLAHQLRNSLTGARVSVQLHQRHCPMSDDAAIDIALKQLTLTEEQIKALLRLSKGESERTISGKLETILDDVIALVRPLCIHQKIELTFEREDFSCIVPDRDAFQGAMLNVLMNAIEATSPRGTVEVVSAVQGPDIVIDIRDSGTGIPAEIRERIFEPFFSTKPEGAGLGLALARKAIEDCQGNLTFEQPASGVVSTTFRVRIPRLNPA